MTGITDAVRSKFSQDLHATIVDVEDLLHLKTADAGEQAKLLRERLQERLRLLKSQLQAMEADAARHARGAMDAVDRRARMHPWSTAGIAAAAGLLVGLFLRRH